MTIKKITCLILASLFFFTACGRDLPFEYKYLSAAQVQITYEGKTYLLNRFGPETDTPFDYAFEDDGDLDVTIDGKTWYIDSPYDIDKPKKKTVKKKRTTKSSTKKKKR